jgi:molecular chaperone GrpE (heat shock protein)
MSDEKRKPNGDPEAEEIPVKVTDRRHWAREEDEAQPEEEERSPYPTMIDEFRGRAEAAERKLHEYIDAFKRSQQEQDQFRERLLRDVDRRVDLRFGELLTDLLETLDDLDLALGHVTDVPEARPLADGVSMARERFLAVLQKHGVESIVPDGEEFDPNVAEAMQMQPVDSPELDGRVTSTLRPGFRLGDRVVRPARVIVGKLGD